MRSENPSLCRATLVALATAAAGVGAEPARASSLEGPAEGVVTLEAVERWRLDTDALEEVLIGFPAAALAVGSNVVILDRQLAQLVVIDGGGAIAVVFGGRGEGPGELRDPQELVRLPEGRIGVFDGYPARLMVYTPGGEWLGRHDVASPASEIRPRVMRARAGARDLVLAVHETVPTDERLVTHFRLVRASYDGTLGVPLVDLALPIGRGQVVIDEARFPYCHWDVAPDGRVYAAFDHERYAVTVFGPSGEAERNIERAYTRRARTETEIARRRAILTHEGFPGEVRVLEHDPDIGELRVSSSGELWVASSRSREGLPEGVYREWDVFDAGGRYVRRARIALDAGDDDEVSFLSDGRLLVFENYQDVVRALTGEAPPEGAEEDAPLQIVSYDLVSAGGVETR